RLILFAMLYFVQGSALAYFRNFQKPYLDSFGIDADLIGLLTTILLLPFILKIFIGMLSDRVSLFGHGHRKPYIVLGLLLAVVAFTAVSFVSPDQNFTLFAILITLGSFSVALFDSTTDGLAIDSTPSAEYGTVQGTMVGGRALGFIILSLIFGLLVQSQGYRIVFLIIAASMLLPLLWVLRVQEPPQRDNSQTFNWHAFAALKQSRFLIFAAYAIIYSIVSFGVDGLVTFFMSQSLGASDAIIGQYGALRGIGAAVGAVGGGLLVDRLGHKRSALVAVVAISIGAALLGLTKGIGLVLALGVVWGIAWGFQETIFVALAMDLSDTRIAASMFAIMMALSNLGTAVGEGIATGLTDNIGFSPVFWLLAALNIVLFPILWGLFKTDSDKG
ncbi:MAG: MFS transporter, partial [Anaerolineales bacterium]|nr:MFS transporter [Anaerolineales bacterium]